MPELKIDQLAAHNLMQITATCQLLPENPYIIADHISDPKSAASILPQPSLGSRIFIPFAVDITGSCPGRKVSIGEFNGYICWYQPNYMESKPIMTMEDVALADGKASLYEFTSVVMHDNGQIHKQWCSPGDYFALLLHYHIDPAFRGMGIGTLLFDNLHRIIRQECKITVRTVFIPPPNEDEPLSVVLMRLWRKLGYKEIGSTGRTHQSDGYFARCTAKEELL